MSLISIEKLGRLEIMETEHRGHTRFLIKDNARVQIEGRRFNDVGAIKDMSINGLAFDYIVDKNSKDKSSQQAKIYLFTKELDLYKFPCKIVYDILIRSPSVDYITPSFITKRCGVQFEKLNKHQKERLALFFKSNAIGVSSKQEKKN